MATAIWWVRRDLRLYDNQALDAALSSAEQVVPVFINDPFFDHSPMVSARRAAFLWDGLRKLDSDLKFRGSYLVIRSGIPAEILSSLGDETGAERIFAEADFSPYAKRRDERVADARALELVGGPGISHPNAVLKQDGSPYTVYTPYMRTWKAVHLTGPVSLTEAPEKIHTPPNIRSDAFPDELISGGESDFEGGENEARRRLDGFAKGKNPPIFRYAEGRSGCAQ
jgi:deoxyribodipyrimidine photo-lyase